MKLSVHISHHSSKIVFYCLNFSRYPRWIPNWDFAEGWYTTLLFFCHVNQRWFAVVYYFLTHISPTGLVGSNDAIFVYLQALTCLSKDLIIKHIPKLDAYFTFFALSPFYNFFHFISFAFIILFADCFLFDWF